jgi:hypothetical protein
MPAGKGCVKRVEEGLGGDLSGWLISRPQSRARRAREGGEAARRVVVGDDYG